MFCLHLKIEAHPSEPTLQDWVGTHEAYPVTEALVSNPTVDAAVREQARRFYSLASVEVIIGGSPLGLIVNHFHRLTFQEETSIDIAVPDQPEAMWMLQRVLDSPQNNDPVFLLSPWGWWKIYPWMDE